ncbi:hypothetical protein SAMN05518672_11623 [Chitinophaga sp. CF118]|uniref:hypothetical protein n=1 Tax=Chitinophaga sp. CF118 TaxID=1884367 RepID=UPI0008EFE30E|nr:hypothetical protein [Chitinophaga sp. CF118]SFF09640.1 hypothetical protein SAMN05518672_11623 [Chitinophaga sp. CF118]
MIIKLDTLNPKTREVADVVILGDHLVQKVALIKAHAKSYQLKVREGDLRYPYGDNRADYILTIHTDYQDIDIRLRYNNRKDKYDILGWMTANK